MLDSGMKLWNSILFRWIPSWTQEGREGGEGKQVGRTWVVQEGTLDQGKARNSQVRWVQERKEILRWRRRWRVSDTGSASNYHNKSLIILIKSFDEGHGSFHEESGHKKGGKKKEGHHKSGKHHDSFHKKGSHKKGSHHHDDVGHKHESGHDGEHQRALMTPRVEEAC